MIAKVMKGKGFRGALEYALHKDKAQLLETNMAGESTRQLASEFGMVRKLRPRLGRAVCHAVISISPNETLTPAQWNETAHAYLDHMGFTDCQFVAVRHHDTDHDHIHIIANRVRPDGSVVSDSNDFKRQEAIMRQLEQRFDLSPVQNSEKAQRRALSKREIEFSLRTGKAPVKQRLQMLIDSVVQSTRDLPEFCARLERLGVGVRLNQAKTGRISGISFSLDQVTIKGSKLGRGYSWSGLQKRGVLYEQDRHGETIEQRREPSPGLVGGEAHASQELQPQDDVPGAPGGIGSALGIDQRTRALQGVQLWGNHGLAETREGFNQRSRKNSRAIRSRGEELSR